MRDLKVYRFVAGFIVAISFVFSINIANTVSSFADESYEIDTDPMICAGDDIYYLQRNGFVSCWGSYAKRVYSADRAINKIIQIDGKYALRQDGTVWNMDYYSTGAVQIEGVDNVRKIAWGYCIKNDGKVYSDWGKGSRIGIGYIEDITDIAHGNSHYLALRSDGTVWAWGSSNNHGQLGTGSPIGTSSTTPVQVSLSSDVKVKAISASGNVSMALDESGNVYTWGDNEYGQLGDGKEVDSNIPIKVPGLSGVTKIVAGPNRCFAYTNTAVYGWGCNNRRQLRYDSSIVYKSPTVIDPLLGSTSLSCGEYYTLYIKNDKVYVFGSDALEGYHRYNYELHGKRRSLGEITEAPIAFSENYWSNGTWGDYRYVTSYIYPPDTIINTRELTDFYLNTRETLTKGSKLTLTITRMPINTVDVYPEIWESSDPEVVAVNEYGTVTAIKAGTANVTATIRGITKTCIITVEEIPLEGISISPLSIINPKLKSYSTLTLNFTPENTTDSIEATWSTSDSNIATVSSTGRVYIKGPGIAEITATVGSFSASCEIKVPYPNMVSFDGNGGVEVPESQEYSYGEDMIIPEAVPVRDGYSFEGWATGKCINDKYKPGDSYSDFIINYSSNQEKTLYAVWRANDTGEIEYAHDY